MALVKLHDGLQVASDSREWLWETLARHVLRIRPIECRREFIAGFEHENGERAGEQLRGVMTALHAAWKAAA
jgi:hypothetical protein